MGFVRTSDLLKISKPLFNSMVHTIVAEILLETGPVSQIRFWSQVCFSLRVAKHTEGLRVLHELLAVSSSNAPWLVFGRTCLYHFPESSTQSMGSTLGLAHVQPFCSPWFWLCSSLNVSTFHRQWLKDCSGFSSHSWGWCHISHFRAGSWGPWRPLCCGCSQGEFPILKTFLKFPYLVSYTWVYLWTDYFTCF